MRVFVDTAYWIAVTIPSDQWHDAANRALAHLEDIEFVTTEDVLCEFLTAMSKLGPYTRTEAARMARRILTGPDITVVEQSHEMFLDGLDLYANRPDKGYSLQDCVSMNVMYELDITQVLTSDRNFEQEGFTILMRLDE